MELFRNRMKGDINEVFSDDYISARHLYLVLHGQIPVLHSVYPVDIIKCMAFVKNNYGRLIENSFSSSYINKNRKQQKYAVEEAYFVLKNKMILKFAYTYCDILSDGNQNALVQELTEGFKKFRRREKRKDAEINLISYHKGGFGLNTAEIKKTKLDLQMCYEDEFVELDKLIQKRLKMKNDKGIVLLHGLPGTGKTTYLRYLIGKLKKRVLFIPPSLAANIANPDFVKLLLDYPNSILVIEDAENIIMDRLHSGNSAVSNLLNISDGLLGDCLNIQIICTFNMPISKIDPALMRKGRLIAKYYFGKLSVAKAQALADKLGHDINITEPTVLTEIFNQGDKSYDNVHHRVIGFRQEPVITN